MAEAREALTALGYTDGRAATAPGRRCRATVPDGETVDALMKRALQQLFKG